MEKKLDLKRVKLRESVQAEQQTGTQPLQFEEISRNDIAIIGMAGRFAWANDLAEFWANLLLGRDCIREFPSNRRADTDRYLRQAGLRDEAATYVPGAYLENIDQFDYGFFKISPKEASLMDPNQRLFLEIAWQALEDAGYGGHKLKGSRTGIYLGFSSDLHAEYKRMVMDLEAESASLAIPGNIKSIIASRIAYLLDFKGPSMLVDTACSSALTALHLACRALRAGECEQALVGGVKINFLPVEAPEEGIGIQASDYRAHTFDDASDGTGSGEGVGAVLLKPLSRAVEDHDYIYAVVKGSAVNQDGASIGITAPNSLAQADVIERAWLDAGVDPETIGYIEAHGTGTRLGDPIEIDGITRAFRKYTGKRQFCGIGSVKTNIGHLDNAAGVAGLFKAVLALKNGLIPPLVHFERPNQKIDFLDSPVFLVDKLTAWKTEGPRRSGISSFGLSGTNCHVVLEEAPREVRRKGLEVSSPLAETIHILALSAKTAEGLQELVRKYCQLVKVELAHKPGDFSQPGKTESALHLGDLCHVASTGRGHYTQRLALLVRNLAELQASLEYLEHNGVVAAEDRGIYYAEHRVASSGSQVGLTEDAVRELNVEAHQQVAQHLANRGEIAPAHALARLYVSGAEIQWERIYPVGEHWKRPLPVYPFERNRCWVEGSGTVRVPRFADKEIAHPLIDRKLAETPDLVIYATTFSVRRHWVLSEHKVGANYIVPGTTYLEMARAASQEFCPDGVVAFGKVIFIAPLIVAEGEEKVVETVIKREEDRYEFSIISKLADGVTWVKHAEGAIYPGERVAPREIDLEALKAKLEKRNLANPTEKPVGTIVTGPRWKNFKEIYLGNQELLALLEIAPEFAGDLHEYGLHPALLDNAVNVVSQSLGANVYLPLSYKKMWFYRPFAGKIYTYLVKKEKNQTNDEIASFDITLFDENGQSFIQIEDYVIKKATQEKLQFDALVGRGEYYYSINWKEQTLAEARAVQPSVHLPTAEVTDQLAREIPGVQAATSREKGAVVLLGADQGLTAELATRFKAEGQNVVMVEFGPAYTQVAADRFILGRDAADYGRLLQEVKELGVTQILHFASPSAGSAAELSALEDELRRSVYSLFHLTRALITEKIRGELDLILVARNVYAVTGDEQVIYPAGASFFGLGKVIQEEHPNLHCRMLDIDDEVTAETLWAEVNLPLVQGLRAYRNGRRYTQEFARCPVVERPERELTLKAEGVYLITGGTGGIGLEMGKYLASQAPVKLALLNRSALPPREEWDNLLAQDAAAREQAESSGPGRTSSNAITGFRAKLVKKIRAIREMEARGAEVCLLSADVVEPDQMAQALSELRKRHGRINGIIHAAGVAGDGFILRKDELVFRSVLAPKVLGTRILDELTRLDGLDFFVLFSSVNALFGAAGQGDYTAANAYLDSYAAYLETQGRAAVSINWPAWKETGMAQDYGVNDDRGIFKALPTAGAIHAFEQILHHQVTQVIVGEMNYETISQVIDRFPVALSSELRSLIAKHVAGSGTHQTGVHGAREHRGTTPGQTGAIHTGQAGVVGAGRIGATGTGRTGVTSAGQTAVSGTVKLKNQGAHPETETQIAQIWGKVLGVAELDIYDNFYELGGDSILATRLLKEMEKEFPGMIDISDIFTYSTVGEMAGYIEKKRKEAAMAEKTADIGDDLDSVLDLLAKGEISVKDADKLIKF